MGRHVTLICIVDHSEYMIITLPTASRFIRVVNLMEGPNFDRMMTVEKFGTRFVSQSCPKLELSREIYCDGLFLILYWFLHVDLSTWEQKIFPRERQTRIKKYSLAIFICGRFGLAPPSLLGTKMSIKLILIKTHPVPSIVLHPRFVVSRQNILQPRPFPRH